MRSNPEGTEPVSDYDPVAEEYAAQFFDELQHKPFDRDLLNRFANLVKDLGPVCAWDADPGQIACYLYEQGADAFGVDLSSEMIMVAQRLSPAIQFEQEDMRQLPAESSSWGGIAAFYAIIHIPPSQLSQVMNEFHRVLKTNGRVLIAYHICDEVVHSDEWWEKPVGLSFHFYQSADLERPLENAGFLIDESISRPPYEEIEHPSQRGDILARKP